MRPMGAASQAAKHDRTTDVRHTDRKEQEERERESGRKQREERRGEGGCGTRTEDFREHANLEGRGK